MSQLESSISPDLAEPDPEKQQSENEASPFEPPRAKSGISPAVSTVALAAGMATAACGGGGGAGGGNPGGGPIGGTPTPTAITPSTDTQAARFALRAGLSVTQSDITELRSDGYLAWLNREINAPIERTAEQYLSTFGFDEVTDDQYFFRSDPADYMIWNQLMTGGNSVRKRIALALSEFFVVSMNNLTLWPSSAIGAYWDILLNNAFGNFRDIIEEISLNPAMGVFLNTLGNQKADPATGRVPDENYGREVMQLFSIGLFELNIDGSVRTDGSGEPLETYTNEDVTGIAKVFTGYNYSFADNIEFSSPPSNPNLNIPEARFVRQPMTAIPGLRVPFNEDTHSLEEKSFLGTTIPAGTGATESLRIAMDTLFEHPNVGPFFGQQMIQRLVTSNPSPGYIQRVAEVFNNNGQGQRGDLAAVFRAIFMDDEALDDSKVNDATWGKLREPMLRFAQWGRTFGTESSSTAWLMPNLADRARRLGQSPLRSPSVFNFFRPGFTPPNSQASDNDLLAPEFQLVNETTAAGYINFMERTIDGRGGWMFDVKATYTQEIAIAHDTQALLDRLDLLLTANQLSNFARDEITAALDAQDVTEASSTDDKTRQVWRAVMLVMSSNDYLIQK